MDALVLFPHQLFPVNDALARGKAVWLVEDPLTFRQQTFHQQKLVLHRASMKSHARALAARGHAVRYLESREVPDMPALARTLAAAGVQTAHAIDPVDDWLERFFREALSGQGIRVERHESPNFLTPEAVLRKQLRGQGRWTMASFYQAQRKRLGILMEDGKPAGGRWSFDTENRKRLPKGLELPPLPRPGRTAEVEEAIAYVEREWPGNPGRAADFDWPVTHRDAKRWLEEFVRTRLARFGDYEDAIAAEEPFLFHSALTPALNIGLLSPGEVLDAALGADGIPLNALEGFVRQVAGWREFMRAAYVLRGRRQRSGNFWNHGRPLPRAFWTGRTGLPPLDAVIRRVLRHGYCHHIERLMVLASFMQLGGYRPDDAYRWFMEMFVDAYDWVMVPNVYGMALHADGGLITTKPYVSGSNYLLKMSDFPRGEWCEDWDALFWRFVSRHRGFFEANPRLGMMARQLDRMGEAKLRAHEARAEDLLERLDAA